MAVRMAIRILQNFHRRFRHIFGPPWDHAAHLRYFQLLLTSNGTHLIAPESKLVIIALAHEQRGNSLPVLPCLPVVLDLLFNRVLEIARIAAIAPKDEVILQVIIYVVSPLELFRIFLGLFHHPLRDGSLLLLALLPTRKPLNIRRKNIFSILAWEPSRTLTCEADWKEPDDRIKSFRIQDAVLCRSRPNHQALLADEEGHPNTHRLYVGFLLQALEGKVNVAPQLGLLRLQAAEVPFSALPSSAAAVPQVRLYVLI